MEDAIEPRELFGGAISMSLPTRFMDISDFRPIPDHQEVFSDASMDQSLIVEVLEHAAVADGEAALYFFQDLAQHNDAEQAQVLSEVPLAAGELPGLPAPATAFLLTGQQAVAKGRQGAEALNKVHVTLCALRLPQRGSDLLLTLNTPIFISEHSAAAVTAGAGFKPGYEGAEALLRRMLATIRINDWGLFGGG